MPLYRYECPKCGVACDAYRTIDSRNDAPLHCEEAMQRRIMPTMVSVFTPYRAVALDKESGERPMIRNKAEHEAFLRRNDYNEVGNDKSMAPLHRGEIAERHAAQRKELAEDVVMSEAELLAQGYVSEPLEVPQ